MGEVDEECFHVCSIIVAHSSIDQKARVHNLLSGSQVSSGIGGSFQTLYMKDMQKDIPNILHACTCCGVYIWFSTDATI